MSYRKFDTGTWQDPWFEELSPNAKLLFLYLWTNDVCNQAGMYQITKRRIEFELGFSIDGIIESLQEKVYWDPERQIIWVKNFVKWQCQNPSFLISALKIVADMPADLQQKFVEYNQQLIASYDVDVKQYHVTTMPTPTPHGVTTNPSSEQNRTEYIYVTDKISDPCPHKKIINLYHQILPELPAVKSWAEERQKQLRQRWKEESKRQNLEWWKRYFRYIRESPFLMGENNRHWMPNLEWLVKKRNLINVIEGKYHNNSP